MEKLSESLSKLSVSMAELSKKAKEAEDRAAEALAQTHEQREAHIAEVRAVANRRREEMKVRGAEAKHDVESSWVALRAHVHEQWEHMRADFERRREELEANKAQRRAERAETYALNAISFADDAVDEAEAAVLEAIDLWTVADEKAERVPTTS